MSHVEGSGVEPLSTAPTPTVQITRLLPVDIRSPWPTEALHFTPWLLANAAELSAALGVDVELEAREHKVGSFSLDIIGKVVGSDQRVIIENQYGPTDHGHLGQILTYAGGTDPRIVVWIAESFREEHRAALDWLNVNTVPGVGFFGVALSAVRIEHAPAHLVAPRLELVCKPNDWEKMVRTAASEAAATVSPTNALYQQFWAIFAVEAKARHWTSGEPPAQNWWDLPSGSSAITWSVSFAQFGCRSQLYFGHPDPLVNAHRLQLLMQKETELRQLFGGGDLIFDELPNNKATRLEVQLQGPKITDRSCWATASAWMVDTQERLRAAVQAVGGIPLAMPPSPSQPASLGVRSD